ncbi:MAG TPA: DUF4136 domain-containing protein [Myxococcota bacterium]|nr:DUF4136 domain-containing protein [Myxococcota bacterium]
MSLAGGIGAGGDSMMALRTRWSLRPRALSRAIASVLALGLMGLAVGCASPVRTDWEPGVDFSRLQRFHWLEPPRSEEASPFADNDLLRKRLRAAVRQALEDRGYRAMEEAEEADFLVTWDLTLDEKLRADGGGVGVFYGGLGYRGSLYSGSTVRSYQESTLFIDILDAETRELIWRGWSSGVIETRDRDRDREELDEGVRQILEAFPPPPDASPS